MRLAAAIAACTVGGAPTGARPVRPSAAGDAPAPGAAGGAVGSGADAPPVGGSAAASPAAVRASAAAHSATRAGDLTMSGAPLRLSSRLRGELTGSRWKALRYAGARPAIRPKPDWVPRPPRTWS